MSEIFLDQVIFIPGPSDFQLNLSALDARHGLHYSPRLHFFRCASDNQRATQLHDLKRSLSSLLQQCPYLGGMVAAPGPDLWRNIIAQAPCGIELTVRDLRSAMPSLPDLEATNFQPCSLPWHLLMPVPADLDNDTPYPAFKVQFSPIEGGTILTFAMSHCVADGNGMDELMRVLIKEMREQDTSSAAREQPTTTELLGMDRTAMSTITSNTEFDIDLHPAYRWRVPSRASEAPQSYTAARPFEATAPELPFLFRIPGRKLTALKTAATTPNAPRPISTHDALVALIWRSIMLIRSRRHPDPDPAHAHTPGTQTSWFMPMSARPLLSLPPAYIGNAVYQLTATLPLSDLLEPTSGLKAAAAAVRQAITSATPARVASYVSLLNGDAGRAAELGWQFENGTIGTTGVAVGTCWGSSSVLYGDWGGELGRTVSFRMVGEEGPVAEVLPRRGDGEAEIVVPVMEREREMLMGEECLGKYIEDQDSEICRSRDD